MKRQTIISYISNAGLVKKSSASSTLNNMKHANIIPPVASGSGVDYPTWVLAVCVDYFVKKKHGITSLISYSIPDVIQPLRAFHDLRKVVVSIQNCTTLVGGIACMLICCLKENEKYFITKDVKKVHNDFLNTMIKYSEDQNILADKLYKEIYEYLLMAETKLTVLLKENILKMIPNEYLEIKQLIKDEINYLKKCR